jgi:signal transduction histidine kinase
MNAPPQHSAPPPAGEHPAPGVGAALRARLSAIAHAALRQAGHSSVGPEHEARVAELAAALEDEFARLKNPVQAPELIELLEARTALADSKAEMQRLLVQREHAQDQERQRIARELHDELQQNLAAMKLHLGAAAQQLDGAWPAVLTLIDECGALVTAAIESNRRIILGLRPQALEDLGLVPALDLLVARFRRRTGVACRLRATGHFEAEPGLASTVAFCLYRVTQEGLGNVEQHAHASEVHVKLERSAQGRVLLSISDNGRGMANARAAGHDSFGLLGIQERVRAIGAELRVESAPGKGTTIEVTVPPSRATAGPATDQRANRGRRATD